MNNFILAIQFFTRIPINKTIDVKDDSFAKGVIFFPIIGLIIGSFNALIYFGISYVIDGLVPIICAVLANFLITGGLHLDGLADTCDGIYSARKKERMLEIMKDSRLGTNGAIAILFDILLRVSLLQSLPLDFRLYALILSPVVGRTMMSLLIYTSSYARENGLGGLYLKHKESINIIGTMIIGIGIVGLLYRLKGIPLLIIAICSCFVYRYHIYKKIDGMTGDTLGATNEVVEVISLMSMNILIQLNI